MVHWMPYPIWGWPVPLLTKGPARELWWRRRRWILDLRPPAQHSKDCLKPTGHQRPQTETHGHRPSLDPTNWAKDTSPACKNGSEASEPFCHVTSKGSVFWVSLRLRGQQCRTSTQKQEDPFWIHWQCELLSTERSGLYQLFGVFVLQLILIIHHPSIFDKVKLSHFKYMSPSVQSCLKFWLWTFESLFVTKVRNLY